MEVHRQHNICLQARRAPHPTRGPASVGACQGRSLQMPQDQARAKVPAPGYGRRLPRPERCGGGQGQSAYPLEGPVGPPPPEVPAA